MEYKPTEKQLKRLLKVIEGITEYGKENILLDEESGVVAFEPVNNNELKSFLFDEAISYLEEDENVTFIFDYDLDGLCKKASQKKLIKKI